MPGIKSRSVCIYIYCGETGVESVRVRYLRQRQDIFIRFFFPLRCFRNRARV